MRILIRATNWLASALGVPTVAVFGATDHETTGPSGPFSRVAAEALNLLK